MAFYISPNVAQSEEREIGAGAGCGEGAGAPDSDGCGVRRPAGRPFWAKLEPLRFRDAGGCTRRRDASPIRSDAEKKVRS